jgi:hypothetical protein
MHVHDNEPSESLALKAVELVADALHYLQAQGMLQFLIPNKSMLPPGHGIQDTLN